jgi:hypothetical protein
MASTPPAPQTPPRSYTSTFPTPPQRGVSGSNVLSNNHTISHRLNTYQSSPSTPPMLASHLSSYPFPESPTRSPIPLAQERHRAQLATYKRDSNRGKEKDGELDKSLQRSTSKLSRFRGVITKSGVGRRLSAVVEDGPSDGKDHRESFAKRAWRLHIYPTIIGRKGGSTRKYTIYLLIILTLYFIFRPLSTTTTTPTDLSSSSAGVKPNHPPTSQASTPRKPLYARPKLQQRPTLPRAVTSRSSPDHPVINGVLQVDPESKIHPIYQLIRDGRDNWDRKVARQSRTLKEAVQEYKKRYNINPPKGFDMWWQYVW